MDWSTNSIHQRIDFIWIGRVSSLSQNSRVNKMLLQLRKLHRTTFRLNCRQSSDQEYWFLWPSKPNQLQSCCQISHYIKILWFLLPFQWKRIFHPEGETIKLHQRTAWYALSAIKSSKITIQRACWMYTEQSLLLIM